MIGTTLSHFEITAKLGEGGMGEVYRATDTRLGREVAIKVLPEAVASDLERLARFEREAKVLASLNHPHIAAIYAIESAIPSGRPRARLAPQEEFDAALDKPPAGDEAVQDEGEDSRAQPQHLPAERGDSPPRSIHFLVMELVEGEDLKQRLERGPISWSTTQPIAIQITEALEAAHRKGIIHRDLKPANIKVTPEGQVKVLDFGLAKALEPGTSTPAEISLSPTLTAQMTQAGVLLGTAAYMSPEQARGQEVDKQTDIWAFGCVLYEMLTGQIAFPGATVTDVIAAVVAHEPALEHLPAEVPSNVREVLRLCLAKEAPQRLHDMGDARLILTRPAPTPEAAPTAPAAPAWRRLLPWALAAALGLLAATLVLTRQGGDMPHSETRHFSINLPESIQLLPTEQIVLSPDGERLVMVGWEDGTRRLYERRLDSTEVEAIPGTEWAKNPFFSPDGQSIGYTRNEEEMVVYSFETGGTTLITRADWGGGSWGPDDTIVYTPIYTSGLHRVPVSGGSSEELTRADLDAGELGHFWPQHLPGGDAVIFTAFSVPLNRSKIIALDLETGDSRVLIEGGVWGRYVQTGHLLFVRDQTLMAVRFDPKALQASGTPVPVLSDLIPDIGQGDTAVTIADNGTLAYVPGAILTPPRQLVWIDRQGVESPVGQPRRYGQPRISPDGSRVALTIEDLSWDLWALELERGTLSRLSFEAPTQFGAVWMPTGDRIVYSQDDPPYNLYQRSADGAGEPALLVKTPIDNEVCSISPDGRLMLYNALTSESGYDLWVLPLNSDGQPEPWLTTPFNEAFGAFSPDGRWIAFTSDETGRTEVYVNRFPEGGRKLQVSLDGGTRPLWSRDGLELYFRNGASVMAVDVSTGSNVKIGQPRELFSGPYMRSENRTDYDVGPDGRFLMIKMPPEDQPREIKVVLDWFRELESLSPSD